MSAPNNSNPPSEDLQQLAAIDPAQDYITTGLDKQRILNRVTRSELESDVQRRRKPSARPMRWAAAAGVAAAFGAVIVMNPFGSSTPSAYASWTAVPTAATGKIADELASACDFEGLVIMADDPDDQTCEVLIAEQRGDYGFAVIGAPGGAIRLDFIGFDAAGEIQHGIEVVARNKDVPPDRAKPIGFSSAGDDVPGDIEPYGSVVGDVGARVKAVEIAVDPELANPDDSDIFPVQATVGNGLYTAWWPAPSELELSGDSLMLNITLDDDEVVSIPFYGELDLG